MPIHDYKHLRLLRASSTIMDELVSEDMEGRFRVSHSHLAMCSFPYRSQGSTFERHTGPWSLRLTTNELPFRSDEIGFLGKDKPGVPSGPRARLILIALASESLRRGSPFVDVRPSINAFAKRLNLPTNKFSLDSLRKQLLNLSLCNMQLGYKGSKISVFQGPIFSELHSFLPPAGQQALLFPDEVRFSDSYYKSLLEHSLPVDGEAIRALSTSARSLDLYLFLAFRLHHLSKPKFISWKALQAQFSDDPSSSMQGFQRQMKTSLRDVLVLYNQAKVEQVRGGLRLYPSPPPVPKKTANFGL